MPAFKFKPNKKDGGYTNGKRAKVAENTIREYAGLKPRRPIDDYHISDLLADIQHLCHRDGLDFDELVDQARTHFVAER